MLVRELRVWNGRAEMPLDVAAIPETERQLKETIRAADPGLLAALPVAKYIDYLDRIAVYRRYRYVSPEISTYCEAIERRSGRPTLEAYHKLLLVTLISQFEDRVKTKRLPRSVICLIYTTFERILSDIWKPVSGVYLHDQDFFSKDLGVCRLKLLPCGADLIDVHAGVPRRVLFTSGIRQALRGGTYFLRRGGKFRPFYESHWDRRLAREFSPEGYDRCYVRIAEVLELNPNVRGMMSSSWLYDPRLESISPDLAFLRQRPEQNGAIILRVGSDQESLSDALKFSSARNRLFEQGRYVPTRYMLIWGRNELIGWAKSFGRK